MKLLTNITLTFGFLLMTSCFSSQKTAQKALAHAQSISPYDAIIVPGCPFEPPTWDSIMKGRVLWSVALFKAGLTKNIIYSGGAVYTPYYEAKIMGLYAQQLGVPADKMFYDTLAEHSTENVYYSYLLAKEMGFKKVALATDPFQSANLKSFIKRRLGTQIDILPYVFDTLRKYNHLQPDIDPKSAKYKKENFRSIDERENFFKRLKGTLGRNIDWKQYKNGRLAPL